MAQSAGLVRRKPVRNRACQVAILYPPLAAILPRRDVQGDYVLIRRSGHMRRPRVECRRALTREIVALINGRNTEQLRRRVRKDLVDNDRIKSQPRQVETPERLRS
jgi:hypothetical protein